jgi:hypothetical protein
MPPGYLGPRPARSVASDSGIINDYDNQQIGLLAYLLPFIEESNIYSGIEPKMLDVKRVPKYLIWTLHVPTWRAANNTTPMVSCPTAPPDPPSVGVLFFLNTYYRASEENLVVESGPYPPLFGRYLGTTNYIGSAGPYGVVDIPALDRFRGVFTNRSQTKFAQISDGSSQTLLIGEAIGALRSGEISHAHSWMGCGSLPLSSGFGDTSSWSNFNSLHPDAVGFCFADGSVHYLATSIDEKVLFALGGISEGDLTDAAAVID